MTTADADAASTGRAWVVPASSIAFAVLFVAGVLTAGATDSTKDKTAEQVLKSFHDGKGPATVSAWLLVLAGLAFVPLAWAATRRVSAGCRRWASTWPEPVRSCSSPWCSSPPPRSARWR